MVLNGWIYPWHSVVVTQRVPVVRSSLSLQGKHDLATSWLCGWTEENPSPILSNPASLSRVSKDFLGRSPQAILPTPLPSFPTWPDCEVHPIPPWLGRGLRGTRNHFLRERFALGRPPPLSRGKPAWVLNTEVGAPWNSGTCRRPLCFVTFISAWFVSLK